MTSEEVQDVVRANMPAALHTKSGAVLMSGVETIRAGAVYVMGLNPGGDPGKVRATITDRVAPANGTSAYTHECWQPYCTEAQPCRHIGPDGRTRPEALVRHQRNMIALTSALRSQPTRICSANAVFARSSRRSTLREQTGLDLAAWWRACWPVHRALLSVVRPRLIVTLGYGENSSAFGLLRAEAGLPPIVKITSDAERGGWQFHARYYLDTDDELPVSVIGAPHPSYFAPGKELSAHLFALVAQAP